METKKSVTKKLEPTQQWDSEGGNQEDGDDLNVEGTQKSARNSRLISLVSNQTENTAIQSAYTLKTTQNLSVQGDERDNREVNENETQEESQFKSRDDVVFLDMTQVVTQEEEPFLKSGKKLQNNKSKYKFLPKLLTGPDSPSPTPDAPLKIRAHSKKCRAFNRFKIYPDITYTSTRTREKEDKFLQHVEETRLRKPPMICVCEEKKCMWTDAITYHLRKIWRQIWRFTYVLCCPPWPSKTILKMAFWPPPREYFFFYNSDESSQGTAQAARSAEEKVRKASRAYMDSHNNSYRFGFEHECVPEVSNVKCFIVETSKKHYLGCVLIKPPKRRKKYRNPRYTILMSHPNGSDISDHLTGAPKLHDTAEFLNCNICTYDYSGYGISSGSPNESTAFSDLEAVYMHLRDVENILEENIVLWGSSIGTAVTVYHAIRFKKIAGVMLFSPPTSILRALCWKRCCCCQKKPPCRNPGWKCKMDRFNTLGIIHQVKVPLLIAHGEDDELVPPIHGQILYEASGTTQSPIFVAGVGHNNLENSEKLWKRVKHFLYNETKSPRKLEESVESKKKKPQKRKKKVAFSKETTTTTGETPRTRTGEKSSPVQQSPVYSDEVTAISDSNK